MGCDFNRIVYCIKQSVSIHAPTWGATTKCANSCRSVLFQSTHPRGVRLVHTIINDILFSFNPRTHVGCDTALGKAYCLRAVSIHAPTWGATELLTLLQLRRKFQSTHPRGVRPLAALDRFNGDRFQSTHPRGVRPKRPLPASEPLCFNPRTHVGCDPIAGLDEMLYPGFNPRTHVGCDEPLSHLVERVLGFNPRTHVGCDLPAIFDKLGNGVSIHAPTWGATCVVREHGHWQRVSIHAPTWGATRDLSCKGVWV